MINLILTVIVLAVPAYMAFVVVHGYTTAIGTTWERLKAAFMGSASIMWARLNALSIGAISLLGTIAPYVGADGIKEAVAPYLSTPFMAGYMVLVLIGSEIARRRTLP